MPTRCVHGRRQRTDQWTNGHFAGKWSVTSRAVLVRAWWQTARLCVHRFAFTFTRCEYMIVPIWSTPYRLLVANRCHSHAIPTNCADSFVNRCIFKYCIYCIVHCVSCVLCVLSMFSFMRCRFTIFCMLLSCINKRCLYLGLLTHSLIYSTKLRLSAHFSWRIIDVKQRCALVLRRVARSARRAVLPPLCCPSVRPVVCLFVCNVDVPCTLKLITRIIIF